MCDTAGPCQTGWAEDLGPNCPLDGAQDWSGQTVYRLFKTKADPKDAFSRRFRNPNKHFPGNADPCRERALSVWLSKERCDKFALLPSNHQKRTKKIVLNKGCGTFKPFEDDPDHLSWWRCGGYDPLRHVQGVK